MTMHRYLSTLALPSLSVMALTTAAFWSAAYAAGPSPKDDIAAQIRTQGYVCEQPLRAARDARRSRPDYQVWILKCSNATYRVSRYPDLAAKVEVLK